MEDILSSKDVSQTSEFSIITGGDLDESIISLDSSSFKGSEHIRFIKKYSKVEDKIVQKIIYYISLFSSEVKAKLEKLNLATKKPVNNPKKGKLNIQFAEENEIKLDLVPSEFIEEVIQILQHYDLIKLSLILCNRFKLNAQIGSFVVSSCIKYSNLSDVRYTHTFENLLSYQTNKKIKQRQQSIIAHEAMHNVLSLIAPKYLTLKQYSE